MTDDCKCTRLRWSNGHGLARHNGVTVDLHRAPDGIAAGLTEIDYLPGDGGVALMRIGCDRACDMGPVERGAAIQFLRRMAQAARDAVEAA